MFLAEHSDYLDSKKIRWYTYFTPTFRKQNINAQGLQDGRKMT